MVKWLFGQTKGLGPTVKIPKGSLEKFTYGSKDLYFAAKLQNHWTAYGQICLISAGFG